MQKLLAMPQRSIYVGVREITRLRIKHMTKTPDYTAMFKDMMGKFPVDMSAFESSKADISTGNLPIMSLNIAV